MNAFSIIKDLISILAVISPAVWAIYLWIKSKKGDISWRGLQKAIIKLHKKMDENSYRPNYIICIGRAGSIAGAMLSHQFGKPVIPIMILTFDYIVVDVHPQYRGKEYARKEVLLNCCTITQGLQNVLVFGVDIMTGVTMKAGLQKLSENNIDHSATACLFWNPNATIKPTFHAETKDKRLLYPWMSTSFLKVYNIEK
jgi:hypoxanthine phosphoribosyltransferase